MAAVLVSAKVSVFYSKINKTFPKAWKLLNRKKIKE